MSLNGGPCRGRLSREHEIGGRGGQGGGHCNHLEEMMGLDQGWSCGKERKGEAGRNIKEAESTAVARLCCGLVGWESACQCRGQGLIQESCPGRLEGREEGDRG